jgi:signal transduction histidine kinase
MLTAHWEKQGENAIRGELIPLGDRRWILVGFPPIASFSELQSKGFLLSDLPLNSGVGDSIIAIESAQISLKEAWQTNLELVEARRVAEESARLKSQFLSTMSHELRTPLNAVIGYSEIMLEGISGDLNEEQTDNIKRIQVNAHHLLSLINDVLDLSKIEAGRLVVTPSPLLIADLMDEVMYQTSVLIGARPIQMQYTLDPQLPREALGDYGRLKQIMINLISNSAKFTDRGEIRLDVAKLDADRWTITVSDTGIGIPSCALEYIFDEFRQVDDSEQRRYGGTGLGLAIVKRLVLLMNGTIRVTSKIGEGSTFIVTLPLVFKPTEVQSQQT